MKLETERLSLKPINESHVEDILKIRSNEMVNLFVQRVSPKTNYDALDFILTIKKSVQNNETFYFGITYKNQQNLLGTICLYRFSEDRTEAEVGGGLLLSGGFCGHGLSPCAETSRQPPSSSRYRLERPFTGQGEDIFESLIGKSQKSLFLLFQLLNQCALSAPLSILSLGCHKRDKILICDRIGC